MTHRAGPRLESPRDLLDALYAALRAVREHPPGHAAATPDLERLSRSCAALVDAQGRLRIGVVRRSLYVDTRRIESDMENFVSYSIVHATLQRAGVGAVTIEAPPGPGTWDTFLRLLVRASTGAGAESAGRLGRALAARGVRGIEVHPPQPAPTELPGEAERREAARRTYEGSVAASRKLLDETRMGLDADVGELRHAVQNIVDGVLHDETSLRLLSALKDYDDYAFTHAVNVCIYCVAIGRRLGLSKRQLYDLGLAGLVHDIGMSRIPRSIHAKVGPLTDEERDLMEAHTWLGALRVFELRDYGDIPFQSMIVAYEHHLKADGSGYPRSIRPREQSVFSKIVAVASAFDAATNEQAYAEAQPADEVLRDLWREEGLGHEPIIVKALIHLLGIHPVGTCVILDTYELAVVHGANPDPSFIQRPTVRLLTDPDGYRLRPAPLVDLTETRDDGSFARSILKVADPERYGVRPQEHIA